MMKTFKPFAILAPVIGLLLFCSVISSAIEEQTNTRVSPVVLVVGVVAIGSVAVSFSRIKKGQVAWAVLGSANIFDMDQLRIKSIILTAIYNHYGWEQEGNGGWKKGRNGRDFDIPVEEARIIRDDLFHIKYLGVSESIDFFKEAQSAAQPFFSNFVEAVPNAKDLRVFFGITGELANGAAAADTPDILAFGTPAAGEEEVTNSLITYEINKRKELEKQTFKSLFVNDDAVKNYFRFPKPIVWEHGAGQELNLKVAKAYGAAVHRFVKFSLLGYKLTR